MGGTKLYVKFEADRVLVSSILIKNGYTVRLGKERKGKSTVYRYYVEIVQGGDPEDDSTT